jgi:hypothetical protein
LLIEITNYAERLKKQRTTHEKDKSSSAEKDVQLIQISETSKTFQFIKFIISKALSRNKRSFNKLMKISFKRFKDFSSKNKSKRFLRTDKEKESAQFNDITESFTFVSEKFFDHSKHVAESLIDSSKNLAKSSIDCFTNFAKSFKNTALFEKTRDEVSEVILQKLKTRHSKTFTNHRKSFHSIIFLYSVRQI